MDTAAPRDHSDTAIRTHHQAHRYPDTYIFSLARNGDALVELRRRRCDGVRSRWIAHSSPPVLYFLDPCRS
jgi:hypothetical protein